MAIPALVAQSPSLGRISWPAFSIQYGGVAYSVPAYNTDKKFTWWKYNGGSPTLEVGDSLPDGNIKNGAIGNNNFASAAAKPNDTKADNWTLKGWPAINAGRVPDRVLAPPAGELWSPSKWTRNMNSFVTEPTPGTFRQTNGSTTWGAGGQVYSSEGYRKNAYVSATNLGGNGNTHWMLALNEDPATDSSYAGLDFAWHLSGGATWYIYENGQNVGSTSWAAAVGDSIRIEYDGTNVRYYLNGSLKRTVARATGNPLYLDSSFYTSTGLADGFSDLKFGPLDPAVSTLSSYALEMKTTGTGDVANSSAVGTDSLYAVTPGMRIYYQVEATAPVNTGGLYVRYNDQTGAEHTDLGIENYTVGPTVNNVMQGSFLVPAGVTGIEPFVLLYAPSAGANATLYLKNVQISTTPIQTALTADDLLLFLNKNGVPVNAQAASVLDGSLIVNESIYADAIAANQITSEHILAGAIQAVHIEAGTITGREIAAKSITADLLEVNLLSAGFTVTGSLQVGTSRWNPTEGFVIPGVVTLAPTGANITAALTATSLTVQKDLLIQGSTNQIKGTLNVANGITTPTVKPTVSAAWGVVGTASQPFGPISYGLTNHLSDNTILLKADSFFGAGISSVVKSTGQGGYPLWSTAPAWTANFYPTGMTTAAGYYWLLGSDSSRNGYFYVYKIDSSFNKVAEYAVSFQDAGGFYTNTWFNRGRPAIGTDGNYIYIAYTNGASAVYVNTLAISSGAWGSIVSAYPVAGIGYANVSFVGIADYGIGTAYMTIGFENFGTCFFNGGTRVTQYDFGLAGSANQRGLWWDGGKFYALGQEGTLRYHGTNAVAQTVTGSYTWFDANATNSQHESSASPSSDPFTRPPRTLVTIDTPLAPDSGITDAGQTDKANQVRIYASNSGSRRLQGAPGVDGAGVTVRTLTLDTFNTGSVVENASGVASFASATNSPGLLQSAGSTSTTGWQLFGDGSGHVGPAGWDAAGVPTTGGLNPIGTVQMFAGATAPTGWLVCNGQAVSRTTYAALWNLIGGTFGTGNGSSTFNVPDLSGRAPVGVGTASGANGATAHTLAQKSGEETHVLTQGEAASNTVVYGGVSYYFNTPGGQGDRASIVGGGAHNNMQPYTVLNFIIRAL